jgi:tetratricopeptide (TPR) repeat protein
VRNTVLFCIILLVVAVLAVYMQTVNHQFLSFDDEDYVTRNPHVASGITGKNIIWAFTSVHAANWHPVTWLSHMADAQFYGMNPRGHHLTNVVIHTITMLLLFLFLLSVTGALWKSFFVAALFGLHPLHVESVAWVAERKDVLSAFFWMLTLYVYCEYVAKPRPSLYIISLVCFALGLMSKPMLVTLPAVLLLLDFWPLGRYRVKDLPPGQRQHWEQATTLIREKIPFFVCSLLSIAVTIYAQHKGKAICDFDEISFTLRIGNALTSYISYIAKTFWPQDLSILYPLHLPIPVWQVISSLIILLLVSATAIRTGRRYPYLAVGWFWFLATLVPVIGLIQVGSQAMADRYTYIPLIGLFIIVAWGVPELTKGLRYHKGMLALLAGAVITVSAALTWQQLGYWQDNISLFRHSLRVTTGNYLIHYSLGVALADKGDLNAAILEYQAASRINPDFAPPHNNLGLAFASKGDLDTAIQEYRVALRIGPGNIKAHNNLGIAFARKGDLDAAIHEFQEALLVDPKNTQACNNLEHAFAIKKMQDGVGK